jgi:tetratricopeptide (TPR) repeat protein
MNHPDFTELRRAIDHAITFNDMVSARACAAQGLVLAEQKECPGERMYFTAQFFIIDEAFEEAIPFLDKAIAFNPADGAAYNDKALCHIAMGRIDGVMGLFDKGIEVEPDYATIHHNKGWFLNKLGQHESSLVCFNQALLLEPERVVTYENMADAYENMGRIKEALYCYKQALRYTKGPDTDIRQQIEQEISRMEKDLL